MTKRSFKWSSWTPTAVLDAANFTDSGYMAIQGGSSTQSSLISEVSCSGQGTTSAANNMVFSFDSTVGGTLTALTTAQSDAFLNPNAAALAAPVKPFVASTTKPQRSATLGLLTLSFNAQGGIYRWVAYPGEEIRILGNTASAGEVSLSCYVGTPGLMASHIIYETD